MDRRQRKSRAAIFSAFNRLLEREAYSSITVQEIIDEADVGRTTFYAHFPTKDDLLKELSNEILDHVFSDSLNRESTHDFSDKVDEYEPVISHILYHIRDNSMNITRILTSDSSSIFMRHFKERFSSYLENMIVSTGFPIPKSYAIDMLSSGLVSTIEWWISQELKDVPEKVASYYSMMFSLDLEKHGPSYHQRPS